MNIALLACAGFAVASAAQYHYSLAGDRDTGKRLADLYTDMTEKCQISDNFADSLERSQNRLEQLREKIQLTSSETQEYSSLPGKILSVFSQWENAFALCENAQIAYDQLYQKSITNG